LKLDLHCPDGISYVFFQNAARTILSCRSHS